MKDIVLRLKEGQSKDILNVRFKSSFQLYKSKKATKIKKSLKGEKIMRTTNILDIYYNSISKKIGVYNSKKAKLKAKLDLIESKKDANRDKYYNNLEYYKAKDKARKEAKAKAKLKKQLLKKYPN